MAFDIYLGKERTFIENYEEWMFNLIEGDENYPKLNWIWEMFYDGPVIEPLVAHDLIHELIELRHQIIKNNDNKSLIVPIDRIMPLLSKAYKNHQQLRCVSD